MNLSLLIEKNLSNDISIQNIINNDIISDTDINRAYSTIVNVVKKAAIESLPIKNSNLI